MTSGGQATRDPSVSESATPAARDARRVNLRDLRYLVAVAEHRHFGRAAEACHVTQPTLSSQIRKLEEALGARLIERGRRVVPTAVGRRVVAQANEVLRGVDALVRLAREHRDPLGGTLRLGVIPTVAPYLLPLVLPAVYARLPNLDMEVVEGRTADILGQLERAEVEAVIVALPAQLDDVAEAPIFDEPFYFAVSPRHRHAEREAVFEAELDQEQVLLLEDGHCLRDQALAICRSSRAVENKSFRATSLETLRQMVAANMGVTLMPELAAQGPPNVRYIPFADRDGPHRTIGICWRASSTRTPLFEVLTRLLREAMAHRSGPAR